MTVAIEQTTDTANRLLAEVVRPMLPVLLVPLGLIWAAMLITERMAWHNQALEPVIPAVISLASMTGWWFSRKPGQQSQQSQQGKLRVASASLVNRLAPSAINKLLMAAAIFCFAAALGCSYWRGVDSMLAHVSKAQPTQLMCRIISDPSPSGYSTMSIASVCLDNGMSFRCRLFWPDGDVPAYGCFVQVTGCVRQLNDKQEFLYRQGIVCSFSVSSIDQQFFETDLLGRTAAFRQQRYQLLTTDGGKSGWLLSGVLLGNSSEFNQCFSAEAFRVTGLSHLVAVSGSHLAVIASLLVWAMRKLKLSTWVEILVLVLLIGTYVVLTAVQPSALRSALMMVFLQGSRLLGRRAHSPSALTATACVMILVHPPTVFSLGFWLSVFAVFGIGVFLPLVSAWFESASALFLRKGVGDEPVQSKRINNLIKRYLVEPVALSLTAQFATLPLTIPVFACITLISLPANLLVTPLISMMLLIGLPGLTLAGFLPPVQVAMVGLLHLISSLTCFLAESLARFRFASAPVSTSLPLCLIVTFGFAALLYWFWPEPSRRRWQLLGVSLSALLVFMSWQALKPRPAELVILDVGQGDALLIREGRITILIDTGADATALRQALARNQVYSLDALILTHLDNDHCGALAALSGTVQPDMVYFAAGLLSEQADSSAISNAIELVGSSRVGEIAAGDTLQLSTRFELVILLPQHPVRLGGNADCIVAALNYDYEADGVVDLSVLLTADAEADILQAITRTYPELRFIAIKVAHHGSKAAVDLGQITDWACQVAIISVGLNNRYGHPAAQTLATLAAADVEVYRTDELGDIHIRFTADGLVISYPDRASLLWVF
ncbi:MAG: DNA internalization-related competence protein ComEC/Rec2 [Coriobacteriia bacterium]|nr:DNA internalization-related competence protein ComEC/Rec2 [Coriobacteriia bacterium]